MLRICFSCLKSFDITYKYQDPNKDIFCDSCLRNGYNDLVEKNEELENEANNFEDELFEKKEELENEMNNFVDNVRLFIRKLLKDKPETKELLDDYSYIKKRIKRC